MTARACREEFARPMSKPLAIELPEHERGRGPDDLKRLDRINARLAGTYVRKGNRTAEERREDDLRERERLERLPALKAEQQWRKEAIEESAALARARGAQITEDKAGIKRILDHDPLASLSWLTPEQFDTGQTLRECYERRAEDIGAMEITGLPSGAHDNARYVFSRLQRAKATVLVGQVTTAILVGHYRTARGFFVKVGAHARFKAEGVSSNVALHALRWVCGEGKTLTSLGRGRVYERNCKALGMALDVADAVIKDQGR